MLRLAYVVALCLSATGILYAGRAVHNYVAQLRFEPVYVSLPYVIRYDKLRNTYLMQRVPDLHVERPPVAEAR
jgi:hypothetical protein